MTRVKICGLTSSADVEAACEAGADAVGFVLEPSSPRYIESELNLPDLVRAAAPFVTTVSVFADLLGGDGVSGHTMVDQAVNFKVFRSSASRCVLARRLRKGMTAEEAVADTEHFAALLLDAFVEGQAGGTGHTVDWDLASEIVRLSSRPVILAGGLRPDNVAEAIRRVRPAAVDVSSGVELSPGVKDRYKVRDFIQAAKQA